MQRLFSRKGGNLMREFIKVAPSVWGSKRFSKLSDDGKILYLHCLTSPRANSAGLFQGEIGYMMVDLKWNEDRIRAAIAETKATGLIDYDEDESVFLIDRWFEFNAPTNPKHAMKVFADSLSVPFTPLSEKAFASLINVLEKKQWTVPQNLLDKLAALSDSLSIAIVAKKIPREREREKETEREREKETFKDTNNQPMDVMAPASAKAATKHAKSKFLMEFMKEEFKEFPNDLPTAWGEKAMLNAREFKPGTNIDLIKSILFEWERFRDYWKSASGSKAKKSDWLAAWEFWWGTELKKLTKEEDRDEQIQRSRK
jgi:hypothetical protein